VVVRGQTRKAAKRCEEVYLLAWLLYPPQAELQTRWPRTDLSEGQARHGDHSMSSPHQGHTCADDERTYQAAHGQERLLYEEAYDQEDARDRVVHEVDLPHACACVVRVYVSCHHTEEGHSRNT
jgi:hypothetical protein